MAPPNKAKAAGVSASSFLDLKAELAKKESEFTKKGAARSSGGDKVCIFYRANVSSVSTMIFRYKLFITKRQR